MLSSTDSESDFGRKHRSGMGKLQHQRSPEGKMLYGIISECPEDICSSPCIHFLPSYSVVSVVPGLFCLWEHCPLLARDCIWMLSAQYCFKVASVVPCGSTINVYYRRFISALSLTGTVCFMFSLEVVTISLMKNKHFFLGLTLKSLINCWMQSTLRLNKWSQL